MLIAPPCFLSCCFFFFPPRAVACPTQGVVWSKELAVVQCLRSMHVMMANGARWKGVCFCCC